MIQITNDSWKFRCIAHSLLSAEETALADLSDDALAVFNQLKFILKNSIHVPTLTEYKSLFDIISKEDRLNEERMMLRYRCGRKST